MIRVLVVDDRQRARPGLITLLRAASDIEVTGEAADGQQAIDAARAVSPGVVLMDLSIVHTGNIFRRIGVTDRTSAALWAREHLPG